MAGEFAPAKAPSKPLVAGKHIAPGPNHLSVVVYCAGSFYQVSIGPVVDGKEIVRLDGDVGRSFGIAAGEGPVGQRLAGRDAGRIEFDRRQPFPLRGLFVAAL